MAPSSLMMQLMDIRCFLLAAELGSVTRAAEALHKAQSAASVSIARLEAHLGTPLLERHPGGVRPTAAGEAFIGHAETIMNCVDRAERELAHFRESGGAGVRGQVNVGIAPSLTPLLLTRLLRAVHREAPELAINPTEDLTRGLLDRLATHELDLVLLWLPASLPSELQVQAVGSTSLAVVMSPDHPMADRPEVSLPELAEESWLAFPSANPARQWIDGSCLRAGFAPRIAHEIESLTELKAFVEAGMGVTLLPAGSVAAEVGNGELVALPVTQPAPHAIYGYAHNSTRESAAVAEVRRAVATYLGDAAGDDESVPEGAGLER